MAACRDMPTEAFFDDVWHDPWDHRSVDHAALEAVREVCGGCPVRRECHTDAMEEEGERPVKLRHGLRALLTPAQRYTLSKRKWRCRCGVALDPAHLQQGVRRCPIMCGVPHRKVPAIPDQGEEWTRRHTEVARLVLEWMEENVEVGEQMPTSVDLHLTLNVRRAYIDRVYAALTQDGVLHRTGNRYTRTSHNVAGAQYLPPHERD